MKRWLKTFKKSEKCREINHPQKRNEKDGKTMISQKQIQTFILYHKNEKYQSPNSPQPNIVLMALPHNNTCSIPQTEF